MKRIDNVNFSEEKMGDDMPDNLKKQNPKCKLCKSDLNEQAKEVIESFIRDNAGETNYVNYLKLHNSSNYAVTSCLRIDYQKAGTNLDNIQMQLGGKKCHIVKKDKEKTTIAAILIEGPPDGFTFIGYNKDQVKKHFLSSYESWKDGNHLRFRMKNN